MVKVHFSVFKLLIIEVLIYWLIIGGVHLLAVELEKHTIKCGPCGYPFGCYITYTNKALLPFTEAAAIIYNILFDHSYLIIPLFLLPLLVKKISIWDMLIIFIVVVTISSFSVYKFYSGSGIYILGCHETRLERISPQVLLLTLLGLLFIYSVLFFAGAKFAKYWKV